MCVSLDSEGTGVQTAAECGVSLRGQCRRQCGGFRGCGYGWGRQQQVQQCPQQYAPRAPAHGCVSPQGHPTGTSWNTNKQSYDTGLL